jgi:hypothetical protein
MSFGRHLRCLQIDGRQWLLSVQKCPEITPRSFPEDHFPTSVHFGGSATDVEMRNMTAVRATACQQIPDEVKA